MRAFARLISGIALLSVSAQALADSDSMRAFKSDHELQSWLDRQQRSRPQPVPVPAPPSPAMVSAPMAAPAPATASNEGYSAAADVVVTAQKAESTVPGAATNITNTQEKNVDEGGIVKVHGNHLVVLRRGRLFTIDVSGNQLRKIDQSDAYPPGDLGGSAWYDEMLVSGDMVVVIGYSYARFGTEINRFRISPDGKLTYLDTHQVRSDDYYSDRNYASRLIGTKLIVYSPIPISLGDTWRDSLPAVRRWAGPTGHDDENTGFKRLTPASRIFMADPMWTARDVNLDTFHTVTICDVAKVDFGCTASAVLGSDSRTFYVSEKAVYVWTSEISLRGRKGDVSFIYRLPLDGSEPQAIGAWGGPVDQFSFREDRSDDLLNVVVRADSGGDRMWRPEMSEGDAALLRLPLSLFGDGSAMAPNRAYRDLPANGWEFHNRFVGQHLLYATGEGDRQNGASGLRAVPLNGGPIRWVPLPHAVTRLDVIGSDGVAIGQDDNEALGFSAIGLNPRTGDAVREDTYLFPHASEGENRSQAFYYRADASDPSGTSGMMALPVERALQDSGTRFLGSASAIVFLGRQHRKLSPAGELVSDAEHAVDDACKASCVDWYGNARPIFLGNRTFALMGYELVEGRVNAGKISEVQRLDFAPRVRSKKDR